jgi:E3 ubiquitin-protein ligase mind-bomb
VSLCIIFCSIETNFASPPSLILQSTNYRVGYQCQYDLIVIDNAQIGVRHPNIICDGCKKAGIAGILFRCAECANFDLCAHCYGNDVHNLEHSFVRYQTANSVG